MLKKVVERIKDFLYDAMDYLLILVIVVVVAGVIGWRLDILFAKDMDKSLASYTETNEDDSNRNIKPVENHESDDEDENQNSDENNNTENDNEEQNEQTSDSNENNNNQQSNNEESKTDRYITVKIPSGSLPPTIANILVDRGVIKDKWEFLRKSQEMKLDTKLKSGDFEIKENSSVEDVIRLLAK